MRRRRYIIQNGVDSPAQLLRYNHGHYTAIQHGQVTTAKGKDSGTMDIVIGTGSGVVTANFANSGVPGGHTGLVGAFGPRNTTGPASTPYTRGIVMPYFWKDLQPSVANVYDFDQLDADVATAQSLGVQLIIRIEVKTFDPATNPAPAYLNVLPYTGPYSGSGGGIIMSRWDPFVKAEYRKVCQAVIARYDVNPYFEGIATQETASNMTAAEMTALGYTSVLYKNALKYEVDTIIDAAVHIRHFAYHNFIPASSGETLATTDAMCDEYCTYACGRGTIVGGPDALPQNGGLHNRVYTRYADPAILYLRGPTFICAQHDSHTQTTDSMRDLFRWATNQLTINSNRLYVDYFFWDFWPSTTPNKWNPDDRDVIAEFYPNTWNSFNY